MGRWEERMFGRNLQEVLENLIFPLHARRGTPRGLKNRLDYAVLMESQPVAELRDGERGFSFYDHLGPTANSRSLSIVPEKISNPTLFAIMSIASKRRFITNKVESEMYTPAEGDVIAKVMQSRGNNLHEVVDEFGEIYVASMPSKFRKAVWIRRGQFVVLRPIDEGDKVKAEIEHVLDEENVLYIWECKKWPERFEADAEQMTRASKRGSAVSKDPANNPTIDDDMLPPSESDEDEDEEPASDSEDVDDEEDSEDDDEFDTYNPNRQN
ncbi:unnamed protein product [Caenorhabditis auriculariae]|uniref:Probable RNA-binding protein EIF1AD n=1 Tax=Caenorhabditis auriculariae TaxID=2777116 RepID=A0A8S1HK40_9PELO|nr:unnamed protein product [Caenorhabditis auriculariae]